MERIKKALTRKFGPLPAWAWIATVGVIYWYYKNKNASVTATTSAPTDTTTAPTPQGITTLAPGESAYDPNTGALVSNPNSGGTGGGNTDSGLTPGDLSNLTAAIQNALGQAEQGQTATPTPGVGSSAGSRASRRQPGLRGVGAIRAPFGHKKPTAPKGYRAVGLGSGFWEFVPNKMKQRIAKPKKGGGKTPNTTGKTNTTDAGTRTRTRSSATVTPSSSGRKRTITRPAAPSTGNRNRTISQASAPLPRGRGATPTPRTTRQHVETPKSAPQPGAGGVSPQAPRTRAATTAAKPTNSQATLRHRAHPKRKK